MARAGGMKNETQRARPGIHGGQGVLPIRDPADLDERIVLPSDQFPNRLGRVSRFDQMLANEEGVVTGVHQPVNIAMN